MLIAAVVVTAMVAATLDELAEGRRPSEREAYRIVRGRLKPLAGTVVREVVAVLVLLVTVVGIPIAAYLLVRWAFATQAAVIEKLPPRRALQRSAELVRGRWWRTFGFTATVNVLAALSGPLVGVIVLLTVTSASLDEINLIGALVYSFTIPLAAIAVTLLYFDVVERPAVTGKRSLRAIVRRRAAVGL